MAHDCGADPAVFAHPIYYARRVSEVSIPVMSLPATFAVLTLLLGFGNAVADPGYYVVTAYDNPGAKTIDFRYWTFKRAGRPAKLWPEVGFGWNVNGRWYTEFLASYIGSSEMATRLSTLNWQNDVLLTRGQYSVDLALHSLLVQPQSPAKGCSLEFGPAMQTEIGRTQLNLNVFVERGFGLEKSRPTEMKYQWQIRHHWTSQLHVGAQGFGELGRWDDWAPRNEQSHRAGPALFGRIGGQHGLDWQAAFLIGSTYARQGRMFSMRLAYEL